MSVTEHVEIPSMRCPPIRRIDAYGLEAVWIGPRYEAGTPVMLLITSRCHDVIQSVEPFDAHMEGSILVLGVDPAEGVETASACIVACYRWLLAQLVLADDVVVVGHDDLDDVILHARERLRISGDAAPRDVTVMSRLVEHRRPSGPLVALRT